jgi:Putative porin
MKRLPSVVVSVCVAGLASTSQAQYFQQQQSRFKFKLDGLARQEWTKDIPNADNISRRRGQLRPRIELGLRWLTLGAGGEFNYSSDKNTDGAPVLVRDNYKSRDARLDLGFARLEPVSWLRLEGGRFEMPVRFTEMIWDRDLRPQGGAVSLAAHDSQGVEAFALVGLWAKGSHVFDDDDTEMLSASARLSLGAGPDSRFSFVASYVQWRKQDRLETILRRQNSRGPDGRLALDYKVVDLVARLRRGGSVESTVVADYCWNTALSENNKGLWLALLLGSVDTARGALEYTYAKVDKDATLAAYSTDDFFWGTGWEGHRIDLGVRTGERASVHAVGQLQRFKDSPRPEDRDKWVKRLRLELRVHGG